MVAEGVRRAATAPAQKLLSRVLAASPVRERVVRRLTDNPRDRDWLIHQIAVREMIDHATFDDGRVPQLDRIRGFEDCYWLFSSNELNYGVSQLRFDEAAYLYRLLRSQERPRVAELGRYKGGTTFLMAAAGARVLALDNNQLPGQEHFLPALMGTLERFGLDGSVEPVSGNAYVFDGGRDTFDLVLVHCSPGTYQAVQTLFEQWWPAVAPGGHIVLHTTSILPGVVAFVEDLTQGAAKWAAAREPDVPGENVFFRKLERSAGPMR